jgi:hypothetical protein
MQVQIFLKQLPACAGLALCLCAVMAVARPIRTLQEGGGEKSLTQANLLGKWEQSAEVIRFLETGEVRKIVPRRPDVMEFTSKPAPGGNGRFLVWFDVVARNDYKILDSSHIQIGAGAYEARVTATTLTLTKNTGKMEYTTILQRIN